MPPPREQAGGDAAASDEAAGLRAARRTACAGRWARDGGHTWKVTATGPRLDPSAAAVLRQDPRRVWPAGWRGGRLVVWRCGGARSGDCDDEVGGGGF